MNETMEALVEVFHVGHRKSTTHYPRYNGQAESTNKTLKSILTKMAQSLRGSWDMHRESVLREYKTTLKVTTIQTPF